VNVYDFDKTIYDGDSSIDFYLFNLKRSPKILFLFFYQLFAFILFNLKLIDKTEMKERFYRYFRYIDVSKNAELFWDEKEEKIKKWYKGNQKEDDVIISASPEFLLMPICKRLGIKHLIASQVDEKTGLYIGENCYGEEKVRRFYKKFSSGKIENFYSDSVSDLPLARLSEKSFLVKEEKLFDWDI